MYKVRDARGERAGRDGPHGAAGPPPPLSARAKRGMENGGKSQMSNMSKTRCVFTW